MERAVKKINLDGVRAVVLFGSSVDPAAPSRDVDIAVFPQPGKSLDRMRLIKAFEESTGRPADVVIMYPGFSTTLGMEIARRHRVLFEATPGEFDEIHSLLIRVYSDTARLRTRRKALLEERLRSAISSAIASEEITDVA